MRSHGRVLEMDVRGYVAFLFLCCLDCVEQYWCLKRLSCVGLPKGRLVRPFSTKHVMKELPHDFRFTIAVAGVAIATAS